MEPQGLDADLVGAAAQGSSQAFARLVERHQQALRAFLRRACRDWALADDLAQETFLVAWSRIGKLEPGANVRAWLCGIGYNKALTALRSERRARQREAAYAEGRPEAQSPQEEDRLALDRAMSDLPLEQRACVALCLAVDFSHRAK
ncbi:MAG TPA: RNA polymerase sigma factor, partial [Phenylobacterium sp.]|nr:RNA polymerase sigma factor [Phenylobacterium sp.]